MPKMLAHFDRFKVAYDTQVLELAYRLRNKKNEYRHILSREAVFKRNESGEVVQVIGIGVDLTDLKEAQEEHLQLNKVLEEKNMELEQSNKELASFNFIASHDLQEPLRKIQTFCAYLLKEENSISDNSRMFLNRMQQAATNMRILINDLLTFSQTGVHQKELDSVDLNDILQEVKSSLKTVIDEKKAAIVSTKLPLVKGISFQLHQLFANLVGNAIKYSKPNTEPVITITSKMIISANMEGLHPGCQYWRLSFKDNGVGFEQKYADKIFELFQRLHSKTEYPGTGIGLAICKKIVQNHGGNIRAIAQPGEGSVFEVFLPFSKVLHSSLEMV
jgi:hypothetical protein